MVLCVPNFKMRKDIVKLMNLYIRKLTHMFFISALPMDTTDSYMGISGKIDVWDGLDDVDLEQSITYNALDNDRKAHECTETFTTNKVR